MSATVWECRICGRRIPLRVDECFCGGKREQVIAQEKREADRSPTKIPLDVALLVALVVLVVAYGVYRAMHTEPSAPAPGSNLLSAMVATPEPMPTPVAPGIPATQPQAPVATTAPPTLPPLPEPVRPAASLAPVPVASASTSPSPEADEREASKAAALAAYSADLDRLAAKSAQTLEHLRVYKTSCSGQGFGTVQISNCDEIEASIRKSLGEMESGLDAAEEQARRAWVTPGMVRDARGKSFFGTRAWEDLQSASRQLRR